MELSNDRGNRMNYLFLLIIVVFISIIIKMHIYPKSNESKFIQWFLGTYIERKFIFLIDIFLGVLYLILYKRYGFSVSFFLYVALASILLTISIIDIKAKIIPDKLIVLGSILGLINILLNNNPSIISGLLGLVICGGLMGIISMLTKGALGMGDAKLFACIGIFLGLQATLGIMLMSTILSGLAGLILLAFRMADRKTTLPFAPFIFAATVFMMISK